MYRFYINKINNEYHYYELARVFLADDEFEVIPLDLSIFPAIECGKILLKPNSYIINSVGSDDRNKIKRELYILLSKLTGLKPGWGTLTGVRPLKLAFDIYDEAGSFEEMKELLSERYLISDLKIELLAEIAKYQIQNHIYDKNVSSEKAGLYIHIPFCPTRCEYCSFATNVTDEKGIDEYLSKLIREIEYTGKLSLTHYTDIESVYIGGGTPTTLNALQLAKLIKAVSDNFGINPSELEFTIEAGRPDTITAEKLHVMREHGISRISINPQSMKDSTLRKIGRDHTADDIRNGYNLAKEYDFNVINADLIAGLPDESLEDFKASLEEIIELGANNITVHTLSVKKGSRLRENDPEYYRRNTETVQSMVEYARKRLSSAGFIPYYIYRQKHQMGALENIGYCKPGKHSVYNIRIMEEKQTIIGLGAGAIGKVYYKDEDRLERIANVSNYRIYSERFDEMLERKVNYFI